MSSRYILVLFFYLLALTCYGQWQKGITVVAPPSKISVTPFEKISSLGADWVAFVPYGFTRRNQANVMYGLDWQWWGEKPSGIRTCIELAHSQGLKVLLKPQVYISGSWTGDLDYTDAQDLESWQEDYSKYILEFAKLAEMECVEQFCIGTEFGALIRRDQDYWIELISQIRKIYSGELTYSANWDNYDSISFWDQLDYIGVSAYFPLVDTESPSLKELKNSWKPWLKKMRNLSHKMNKKVLFTEYGYLSVDGAAGKTWLLEENIKSRNINEEAQATSLEALYSTFSKESFWQGGFLWKWFPEGQGHEGYPERDYTPQDKLAEEIVKKYFLE